jgi:hypothetical protein
MGRTVTSYGMATKLTREQRDGQRNRSVVALIFVCGLCGEYFRLAPARVAGVVLSDIACRKCRVRGWVHLANVWTKTALSTDEHVMGV